MEFTFDRLYRAQWKIVLQHRGTLDSHEYLDYTVVNFQ